MTIEELRALYEAACQAVQARAAEWDALTDDSTEEDVTAARTALTEATVEADRRKQAITDQEAIQRARAQHTPSPVDPADPALPGPIESVDEPDMYVKGGRSFLGDLYAAQLRNDPAAAARIARHQEHEVEKRAIDTGTLGGIIPPQYLVDMYAKASRSGRVFADQANGQDLPEEGMALIIPRITQGTAADVQAAEGDVVATQDVVEVDLTIPVRTIAGYIPVSRQTLERASYSEPILFEDLLARYWAALDKQAISGSGAAGQMLGLTNTAGVVAGYAGSNTVAALWGQVARAKAAIETKWGGLGISPTKQFMHPRRWGQITSYVDSEGRPLFGIGTTPVFNVIGEGSTTDYGPVGYFQGLPVFTDANIPVDLGTNADEDAIIITSDPPGQPLLWERNDDPVTLAFEQQAGTALMVQLIAYGYAAFSAGRYPDASAVIDGFPTPTYE